MNQIFLHPKLVPYVTALTLHEFGLEGEQVEITNIESGSIITKKGKIYGDRFQMRVLYCKKRLTWEIIMNPYNLMEPPDFILEDDFLADADYRIIETNVPSLVNWEPSDPKCLLNVVLELLLLYKRFQGKSITFNHESRLSFEFNVLLSSVPLSDMEIYVHSGSRVSLLTNLSIDCSKLPIPIPKQKYLILLLINIGDNMKNVTLFKNGALEDVFGNINLPDLTCEQMLIDYIETVKNYLQSIVDNYVSRLQNRKILYSYFYQFFEPAILNGDNILFRRISFLLEDDSSFYVMLIEIPLNFPDEQPMLNMASMTNKNRSLINISMKKSINKKERDIERIFWSILEFIRNTAIGRYRKMSSFKIQDSK